MIFYIDPGTGSMLFTILIGVIGAAIYALRNSWVKLKVLLSGGKNRSRESARIPFVFFTDSKRYWTIFKPLCDEMEKRGETVLYLTASPDDPLLKEKYEHVKAEFAGEGNRAFARMNMLQADVVLSSTPGLDVYQWKRSRDVSWYVHVLHAANGVTCYRMFGIDYYDALLLSGEYQINEVRKMEALRHLPPKECVMAGLPHMDSLRKKWLERGPAPAHKTTVLLAPSWGPSSIFNRFGEQMIENLCKTGYHIILRPHPQSMTSEKELIDRLRQKFPESEKLEWNFDNDNFDVLYRSDLLISDYSGVVFDFALVFDRPIIYADVDFDYEPYDAGWLDEEMWTFRALPKVGMQLTQENADKLPEMIEESLHSQAYAEGRKAAIEETWANVGNSVPTIADYLSEVRQRLLKEAGSNDEAAETAKQKKRFSKETRNKTVKVQMSDETENSHGKEQHS